MDAFKLFELSKELSEERQPHAWVTVIGVQGATAAYIGAQAIVDANGEMHGWIGGGCVQGTARLTALEAIVSGVPRRVRLSNSNEPIDMVTVYPMACVSNGEVDLFIQPMATDSELRIYGNTPVAHAAVWLAREMAFTPLTDADFANKAASTLPLEPTDESGSPVALQRESYALIATQGDGDELALETALRSPAKAVLVVASKRKAERLRNAMLLRGITEERLAAMHSPAGPDIGAVTPNEIALAAVAGLITLRQGSTQSFSVPKEESAPLETAIKTGYVNPVCGAVIAPKDVISTLTVEGQTHYFCCQCCRIEFERDPNKYLEISARMCQQQPKE
jgi:xanthine dehydrogenase accessory factor